MTVPAHVIDHKALLVSAEALGALPITVTRLATVVSDPHHDIGDIEEVVGFDASLTAALLRRANSAALGGRVQVKTVRNAAILLGSGTLLSLALSTSVSKRLSQPIPGYGLAEGELWRRSVAASLSAEAISAGASVEVPAEASTAALLHDFGKVVLAQHFGAKVLDMLIQAAAADNVDLLQAESNVFGVNHADIGGLVAQQWKLPHTIVDAILHHHEATGHGSPVSAVVSLAHAMVPDVLQGVSGSEAPGALPEPHEATPAESHGQIMVGLGLDPERYDELLTAAQERYLALAARYAVS